ncbi:esterase [Silvimonas soli]|uniref:esterase n=1 Tax=Silvimonas soli TaxID=2980100 RepID=UPI0024B36551|nr:esterase [Silvimonas soli]
MNSSIIIQQPQGSATQLILLFHGVGASPEHMVPLGEQLAARFAQAFVVSVQASHASDLGSGYQWFSVRGVTEENRPARVAEALPVFVDHVKHWQTQAGVNATATVLVGFSQGAIMVLESTQLATPIADRVIALSGRFALPPRSAASGVKLHLIHGTADAIMPYQQAEQAARQLNDLGAEVTLDLISGLGHGVNGEVLAHLLQRLTS